MTAPSLPGPGEVARARAVAARLLGGSRRWEHTRGVAARAEQLAPAVRPDDRGTLVAAAWLHDVGYAEPLQDTGFHPLDGARHLARTGWHPLVVALVAHHSGADLVAEVRGLRGELAAFDDPRAQHGPLADALTCADQTTDPDGRPVDVQERLADMLSRHGPDSPNARVHPRRGPAVVGAVRRTLAALEPPP